MADTGIWARLERAAGVGVREMRRIGGGHGLAAYHEARPLADGWRSRVPLHQLHPLLAHVCLFGAGYRGAAIAARAILGAG